VCVGCVCVYVCGCVCVWVCVCVGVCVCGHLKKEVLGLFVNQLIDKEEEEKQ
jgi:hypothetical protein